MSNILAPFQLLELNVISGQDLAPVARSMRTYAVAWVHIDRKLSTRVDTEGHNNPTWNDKFVFRVDDEFLYADTSAIMIEIYALHWFKDIHVGTVRVLVANLIPPPSRPFHNNHAPMGMRFVALQVRRPSGRPQGILNIGLTLLDSSMRSMPLYTLNSSAVGYRHLMGEEDAYDNHKHIMTPQVFVAKKPELRRTKSDTSSMIVSEAVARQQRAKAHNGKASSVITGSEVSTKSFNKIQNQTNKNKKKRGKKSSRSKTSSMLSGFSDGNTKKEKTTSSILSDSALEWNKHDHHHYEEEKMNNHENVASIVSDSELQVKPPPPPPPPQPLSPRHNNDDHNEFVHVDENKKIVPSFKIVSEDVTSDVDMNINHNHNVTNIAYHASPKPQFLNSPAPEFRNSPKPQFRNSPAVVQHFRNSPAPKYIQSPAPKYLKSPAVMQFKNSPKQNFRNSPVVVPQFRNSPAISKFNPAVGLGGSHWGTPLHPVGRLSGAFDQYGTPRRSNKGNNVPPVITESELGPSPSEVAAAIARKQVFHEVDNSTVGGMSLDDQSIEGLQSKLERWRTELPPVIDRGEMTSYPTSSSKTKSSSRHTRRHTDGEAGLFSCFSNICGVECSIVCGGPKAKKNQRRRSPSSDTTSFL
ncbi:hypothetical protein Lal_00021614 [Lupinus albus]|uniref:Putative C2 domain-containing protein n=1 Tax=Lupinus albus TaxID=3870 RepID=A0A6A4N6P4_LUPAL|nr:putative C2 domain-containing protein [Lupinus albus]KAF1860570.1 hypothetical protein Lal_00021614 [Lupinus albus]